MTELYVHEEIAAELRSRKNQLMSERVILRQAQERIAEIDSRIEALDVEILRSENIVVRLKAAAVVATEDAR
jgi:hypothetical protein